MFYIRTTKTASGATAVQVVRYQNRKMIIALHLGSARNKEELTGLKQSATLWIEKTTKQSSLFPTEPSSHLISLGKCRYLGFRYGLLYRKHLQNIYALQISPVAG